MANIKFNNEGLNACLPKTDNKAKLFTLTAAMHSHTRSPSTIREEKQIKGTQILKEELKLSLFTGNMTKKKKKKPAKNLQKTKQKYLLLTLASLHDIRST